MALIKCKECGQPMSSGARACPHCGKQRPSAIKTGCAWIIVLFGAALVWSIWQVQSDRSVPAPATAVTPVKTSTHSPTTRAVPSQPASSWRYTTTLDAMSGKPTYTAMVQSKNTVEFGFPYNGTQSAMIGIRKAPRSGLDIMFMIERGQITCDVYTCPMTMRFDDGKMQRVGAAKPRSGSTTAAFLPSPKRIVDQLVHAKTLRIEATFYQEGAQVFVFNVSNLDAKKLGPTK